VIALIDRQIRSVRDAMSPGQRWTAALALVVAIAVVAFGLPHQGVVHIGGAPLGAPSREAAPTGVDRDAVASDSPGGAISTALSPLTSGSTGPSYESPSGTSAGADPGSSTSAAGKNGECEMETRSIDNPRRAEGAAATQVWIYEPAGDAPASITGGRCDDKRRPAVFLAHGFGQTDPTAYEALIRHFVSVGNVVVYPIYNVDDGERSTLEESNRVVDAGFVGAVEATPRIDTSRVGWWGHSHGGGMIPYLAQQGGARGWGKRAFWMSVVAQAYTQLVGAGDIPVPANAEEMTVAFHDDALADARLGIDVFKSLQLPRSQKRYVMLQTGASSGGPFVAEHGAPEGGNGTSVDAVDELLWRYADLLELCGLHDVGCDADLTTLPAPDGTEEKHGVVSDEPVDAGPTPVILAECDAGFGPTLNPRIERCGETKL
jgi:hypothetical protein